MDYETFLLALSDIANTLYQKYVEEQNGTRLQRGEAQALLTLIREHIWPLDDGIQEQRKAIIHKTRSYI